MHNQSIIVVFQSAYDPLNSPFKKFLIIKIWHKYFALKILNHQLLVCDSQTEQSETRKKRNGKTSRDVRMFIKAGRSHTPPVSTRTTDELKKYSIFGWFVSWLFCSKLLLIFFVKCMEKNIVIVCEIFLRWVYESNMFNYKARTFMKFYCICKWIGNLY